jgi:hypothetical protein
MCWIPINYRNEAIRRGCTIVVYYDGLNSADSHSNGNNQVDRPGWLILG